MSWKMYHGIIVGETTDKLEILEKAQLGVGEIYALCAEGKEKNAERIENEMQGWVATLIYAGFNRAEIVKAFQDWQIEFEKENTCIDEQLNKIFDVSFEDSKMKNNRLFENMIFTWINNG